MVMLCALLTNSTATRKRPAPLKEMPDGFLPFRRARFLRRYRRSVVQADLSGPKGLIRRGHLKMPIVGVARSKWSLDQVKARARIASKSMVT